MTNDGKRKHGRSPKGEFDLTRHEKSVVKKHSGDVGHINITLDDESSPKHVKADKIDYAFAIGSGLACATLDIVWVGSFDLRNARAWGAGQTERFVMWCAKQLGSSETDIVGAVSFLEGMFPAASDAATSDFGGGLQHHLRDFAHHPTIVGLICSLLTQFSGYAYGTSTDGSPIRVDVSRSAADRIGTTPAEKVCLGVFNWFFHLVSDMAGSSKTAALSGGTGIPGPLLSLAKELSTLPFFRELKGEEISRFISKLFNGTLFAEHDESGKIIPGTELRFDLRTELGIDGFLSKEALPVIANECFVRCFCFLRQLYAQLKGHKILSMDDLSRLEPDKLSVGKPAVLSRMVCVANATFAACDVAHACVMRDPCAVNIVGIGRLIVSFGKLDEDARKKLKSAARKVAAVAVVGGTVVVVANFATAVVEARTSGKSKT